MATGDNVLTAISVGRECKIIHANQEVYLGDVKKVGDNEIVYWKNSKNLNDNHILPTVKMDDPFEQNHQDHLGFEDEEKQLLGSDDIGYD